MAAHEQVFVKVNAPVDRGAASLISALSAFPKLQTVESCEDINGSAWVTFIYGDNEEKPWQELADFVLDFLGPQVVSSLGDRVTISIVITEAGLYRAEMAVRVAAIPATVKLLTKLRADFKD